MLRAFVARFLPPQLALTWAEKLRIRGERGDALTIVDGYLERIASRARSRDAQSPQTDLAFSRAQYLRGSLLLDFGRVSAAVEPLLLGYAHTRLEPAAFALLSARLLEARNTSASALRALLDYFAAPPPGESPRRVRSNEALMRELAKPATRQDAALAAAASLNRIISARLPAWAWPRLNLAAIAAARRDWKTAAAQAEQACKAGADQDARALWSYALARLHRRDETCDLVRDALRVKMSRPAALLFAHAARASGEPALAVACFAQAHAAARLEGDALLGYAESLINCSRLEDARKLLAARAARRDPRWLLLASAAAASDEAALDLLRGCFAHEEYLHESVCRALQVLVRNPRTANRMAVLDAVPRASIGDDYWKVRSNVLLADGDFPGAIAALEQVGAPAQDTLAQLSRLAGARLARRYEREGAAAVLAEVRHGMPEHVRPGELETLVAAASISHMRAQLPRGAAHARSALRTVDAVLESWPTLVPHPEIRAARALLLLATGAIDEAYPVLRQLMCESRASPECRLQYARCALARGDAAECEAALALLDHTDTRVRRVASACAAFSRRYEEALALLPADDAGAAAVHRAALLHLTGGTEELCSTAQSGSVCSYYAAAARARSRDAGAIRQWLARAAADHPLRPAATRLLAWHLLQDAHDLVDHTGGAARAIDEALALWGRDSAFEAGLTPLAGDLLARFMDADARSALRAGLLLSQADDPTEPSGCHRRGIFHFCEAEANARAGRWDKAIADWRSGIAFFTIALADARYVSAWLAQRTSAYGASPRAGPEALSSSVLLELGKPFDRWQKRLSDTGERALAARIGDLALELEAETRGAAALGHALRAAALDDTPLARPMGPLGITRLGLERPLAELAACLRDKVAAARALDSDFLAALLRAMTTEDDDGETDEETLERLERLFSYLRHALVLEDKGRHHAALEHLRAAPRACFARSSDKECPKRTSRVCRSGAAFAQCNPAFARDGGAKRLEHAARKLEVSLLLRIAEQHVSSGPSGMQAGVRRWREALGLCDAALRDSAIRDICKVALGRARVLQARDRENEAIGLLEEVYVLVSDESIAGELAALYAKVAITAINERDEWDNGLAGLRRARGLNRCSPHIGRNLAMALHHCAMEIPGHHASAAQMLREARDIVASHLRDDPDNSELQEMSAGIAASLVLCEFAVRGTARTPAYWNTIVAAAAPP
jgi:thioredoxin-like negative regulator of GroEL